LGLPTNIYAEFKEQKPDVFSVLAVYSRVRIRILIFLAMPILPADMSFLPNVTYNKEQRLSAQINYGVLRKYLN
jgi:hypothetical protein